ncbi:MAG TPA: tetratricopeptide repeat protein [Candidatus Saccharimonadales bacterium]|nr:tetratricopeptide repeat protein [Candidatus Saccharimonadales bacterium]
MQINNIANENVQVDIVRPRKRWKIIIAVACIALVIAGGITAYLRHESKIHAQNVAAANKIQMVNLQKKLTADQNSGNFQLTVNDASTLINGKLSGKYQIDNKKLADYYMQTGAAYFNLKNYAKAKSSYEAAVKYDKSIQRAALQGEVSTGYAAGEREQLIPLLQQLKVLANKPPHDILDPSASMYDHDIYAIQHKQEISL